MASTDVQRPGPSIRSPSKKLDGQVPVSQVRARKRKSCNLHDYVDSEEGCLSSTAKVSASVELEPSSSPEDIAEEGIEGGGHD